MLLKNQAVLVCKIICLVLSLQHEWCLSICWYIWLHHDEYCRTLYSFRCGMGSYRQIHRDFCVLVEPQGTNACFFFFGLFSVSSRGIGKGYWLGGGNEHLSLIIWLKNCTIVLYVNFWTSGFIWAISLTACPKQVLEGQFVSLNWVSFFWIFIMPLAVWNFISLWSIQNSRIYCACHYFCMVAATAL